MPKQTIGRTLRRVRGMYVPPWVPVLFIIVVVFGILGALFVVRTAAGKPRIGQDHWHATYSVFVCGQRQPNFPTWEAGVHTHGDGVIHIHPFVPAEEGAGARLVRWFEYGGGKLTQTEMRMPGDREEYKNGDECDDGTEATLQVFVNGEKLDDWSRYIPKDGDRVRIVFGAIETEPVELEDRTVIAETEATRTVEVEITGGEPDAAFSPASIDLKAGETVKVVFTNNGSISHSVRVPGLDGLPDTTDDFVASTTEESDILTPGEQGAMVVRFDEAGDFPFSDPTATAATGTFVVGGEAPVASPTPEEGEPEPVDVELDVSMGDNFYAPNALEVAAGEKFRINLSNDGEFVHNLRIAGPDGVYDTDDDLASEPDPQTAGEDGEVVGQIDTPGTYPFRCDFHPVEMTGTITVR
jgi:plastocyanin